MTTVIDVFRRLGLSTPKRETWAIGRRARDLYKGIYGEAPPKPLAPKTNGGGSHCIAAYSAEFVPMIEQEIGKLKIEQAAQLDLFR